MVSPPETLSEMHFLLSELRQGKGDIQLGKSARQTLSRLLEMPRQTAIYPINQLAESCQVSASTLSRLASRLGFHGFKQFQQVFKQHLASDSDFYSNLAHKMQQSPDLLQKNHAIIEGIAKNESANILQMCQQLNNKTLSHIVDLLINKPHVRVVGYRQSASLASHFSYCLGMLRRNVDLLSSPEHGAAHGLAQLAAGDLLIVYSFYPYTRTTVTAAHIAAAKGVQVVVITDEQQSPLTAAADYVIITPTAGHFYSNSMASTLVFNEMVLSLVARKLGDNGIEALKQREHIIDALEAEFGEH
ncbi:MAG TPA: MurR/RpiR family transcriptional regulator [Aeromonadales bacterium]|nr:MurR/RpiR family transcriptional regulator [Aeromonadales bacterium]